MVPLVLHTCAYTHPRAGLVCVCVFNSIGLLFLFWDYVNLIIRNFDTFLNFYFEMINSQKAAKQHRGRADPHPASPRGGTSKLPHEAHAGRRPWQCVPSRPVTCDRHRGRHGAVYPRRDLPHDASARPPPAPCALRPAIPSTWPPPVCSPPL